ncbi:MAG: 30S ribosomal protein S12 methylthiotransferase RimO [Defluviitaleaceae bacterium]|nr:30S ribosomal protein S12 methylthiotransferase RimO [Defluviitaleaceae bacterium]
MKIAFISLGCDKNTVDSEVMLGIIQKEGYTIVVDEVDADVIIVNTCGFILEATDEGVQAVLAAAEHKETGNCKALIVTGCMAQRYKDEIMKEIPEIDGIVGTGDFEEINKVIKGVISGEKIKLVTDINKPLNEEVSHERVLSTPPYVAFLKIAEGCDNLCTYCTIPSLRGKYRSRKLESLVKEVEILANKGVKEIILVAQDTSLYGTDLYSENRLHILLQELSSVDGIEWIRLMYCYPEHITDETIKEMAGNNKVCKYLDMPIQHSNNEILKKMGRKSNTEKLREVISKLRRVMPEVAIRTTLIVGFPSETEEQFNDLCEFVKEMQFERLGVFEYSQEEGTPASLMDNQIDEDEKARRKAYILELQKGISAKKCDEKVGKVLDVLVEGKLDEENVYCGRTYADSYEVDGMVFFESEAEIISGEFVKIMIVEASDYDLIGEIYYEPTK